MRARLGVEGRSDDCEGNEPNDEEKDVEGVVVALA
jgi:hypothetical protein